MNNTVTMSALIRRINRKLGREDEKLRKTRGGMQAFLDLGDYWVHDLRSNFVCRTHVDPEELGRELGVLDAVETVKAAA
jgi:hypothetical protein